jgi:Ca2+-dependent lipid-binding protein
MDLTGSSDPYVVVTCDHKKDGNPLILKTKTVHESLNPMFNETLTIPWNGDAKISLDVFDYDIVT